MLAPFAALGRLAGDSEGMAAARLAFMLIGALSAVLVWRIASRVSPRAGLVAGLFYALWQPAAYAERTTLLEPLVNLGLLGSLALLGPGAGRRRIVAAGVVLGLAVAVKAWAVLPFLVLALWLLRRAGWRATLSYVGAGAAAAAVVCLPFLVLAGPRMLRMVVLDQLGRPNNGGRHRRPAGQHRGAADLPRTDRAPGWPWSPWSRRWSAAWPSRRWPGAGR